MVTTSLNSIVRNILMKRGYPIHYYMEFLLYAREALQKISLDDLLVINTQMIPIDSNMAGILPNDFQDEISVNLAVGQKLRPLVRDNKITPLQAFTSDFAITTYQQNSTLVTNGLIYGNPFLAASWNVCTFNEYGEPTGRIFGAGAGSPSDTYNIFKSRNQIQLNERSSASSVVLMYIGDGTSSDNATHIDVYARDTIDSYSMYLFKLNNRTYSEGDAERARLIYIDDRLILRARLSDITINGIRRIIQRSSTGSIHN